MLNQDDTAKLLNWEDVTITKVENIADQLHIHLQLPRNMHTRPCCGAATDRVHDYREQIVKDIPPGRTTFLHLRKRRYRCTACGSGGDGHPGIFDCTRACHHWFQEILNAMDCPWNNGYTEGCNHKTKVLKRACYGVRNFR